MFENIIKRDKHFFVSNEAGDATGESGAAYGLYLGDTRMLSRYVLSVAPGSVNVVSSSTRSGDAARIVLLADELNSLEGPPRELVLERRSVIRDGLLERIALTNYGSVPCDVELTLEFAADFRDMFEVRGLRRKRRGTVRSPEAGGGRVEFRYVGLDNMEYTTVVALDPAPTEWRLLPSSGEGTNGAEPARVVAVFTLEVPPGAPVAIEAAVAALVEPASGSAPSGSLVPEGSSAPDPLSTWPHSEALRTSERELERWLADAATWRTDNASVNEMLQQSLRDIRMLLNDFGHGPMPTAGVPWYAAPFGRDSLITALQMLSVRSDIAASTLRTMAHWQGTKHDPEFDEAPGKIMHELRQGELARTKEIPFVPYYGTVDATPLFLITAGEYRRWTGDSQLITELMPALRKAARWLDDEADEDGYIAYHRRREGGLTNQGWKDSGDAIVHRDGTMAKPSIFLAEVQGYVYAARRHFADLLEALGEGREAGDLSLAAEQRRRADALKEAFNRDFWVEETRFYAMALDGDKRPVASVASNPGHCLWSGIVAEDRTEAVVKTLLGPDMFSGYGVRTLSATERAYHPLSYHRGTVWPHDNSLIALGLARSGFGEAAARIAAGLFAVAGYDGYRRLPELFGGFPTDGDGPVWYPVACIPQAWAAGAPYMLLQAALGLEADAPNDRLHLSPRLPAGINRVELSNLAVGRSRVQIVVERKGDDEFDWDVQTLKGRPLQVRSKV